jgi:hypothetical protein
LAPLTKPALKSDICTLILQMNRDKSRKPVHKTAGFSNLNVLLVAELLAD